MSLTKTCSSKQADATALLAKIDGDLPLAEAIVREAMAGCSAGGEAAALLTCKVDGSPDAKRRLAKLIIKYGCWPSSWRTHCMLLLYKKRSVFNLDNYRGI